MFIIDQFLLLKMKRFFWNFITNIIYLKFLILNLLIKE